MNDANLYIYTRKMNNLYFMVSSGSIGIDPAAAQGTMAPSGRPKGQDYIIPTIHSIPIKL